MCDSMRKVLYINWRSEFNSVRQAIYKMQEKEVNYIERQRNWQNKAIEQLGFANNFLLTLSVGLLVFLFKESIFSKIHLCICGCSINLTLTLYVLAFLFVFLSSLTGTCVVFTRLYDYRISRHIVLTRQRFYIANKEETIHEQNAAVLWHSDFKEPKYLQRIGTIIRLLFLKLPFLNEKEMKSLKSQFPKSKFESLRKFSFWLGIISWKWTKLQSLYFALSIIFYSLYLFSL